MGKARIEVAESFERNLDAIALFLTEAEATAVVFDELISALAGRLFPLLDEHPQAGRDWFSNPPPTEIGQHLQQAILKKLAGRGELREFVFDHHLVLYRFDGTTVTLLAIRHQKQPGYDIG